MYNEKLNDALESAYDSGYEKALHDMELYHDTMEDVDIYDDYSYDDAMEGNPENKAKKNKYLESQAPSDVRFMPGSGGKLRAGRSKNYVNQVGRARLYRSSRIERNRQRSLENDHIVQRNKNDARYSGGHADLIQQYKNELNAKNSLHMTPRQKNIYDNK